MAVSTKPISDQAGQMITETAYQIEERNYIVESIYRKEGDRLQDILPVILANSCQ